jgi:hypothetical protein
MTKEEIQTLINNIDTTGNRGTTGQELKNIHEAFKNELDEYTEITLTDTQIKTLNWSTGFELLPAPGENKYFSKISILAEFIPDEENPIAFEFSDDSIWLDFYLHGQDNFITKNIIAETEKKVASFDLRVNTINVVSEFGAEPMEFIKPFLLVDGNKSLELYFGASEGENEISAGNGSLRLKISYKIETFGSNL